MPAAVTSPVCRFQFTVDDYYRLAETGILQPDARVELIHGEVICMAPIGRMHAGVVNLLADHFSALSPRVVVAVQNPVRLDAHNEPQPDVMLLKPRKDRYKRKTVTAEDVLLAIEVSDTTFDFDFNVKRPLYAKHRIPETWVINLNKQCVHVCRDPRGGAYQDETVLHRADWLAPLAFPEHRILVRDVAE